MRVQFFVVLRAFLFHTVFIPYQPVRALIIGFTQTLLHDRRVCLAKITFFVATGTTAATIPVDAVDECDQACLEERTRIIQERRAMMRQSRSSVNRQGVFELSRQRAALYNTTYRGATCPPGVPCL